MTAWRFTLSDHGRWYFGIIFADTEEEAKIKIESSIRSTITLEHLTEADSFDNDIYIAGAVLPTQYIRNKDIHDIFILKEGDKI